MVVKQGKQFSILHILLLEGKAAEAWRWPPTPFSAGVKERSELYLYSASGPSSPILGQILPLPMWDH
jgi:hypothetical protein